MEIIYARNDLIVPLPLREIYERVKLLHLNLISFLILHGRVLPVS